jgi:hypothetical protein
MDWDSFARLQERIQEAPSKQAMVSFRFDEERGAEVYFDDSALLQTKPEFYFCFDSFELRLC